MIKYIRVLCAFFCIATSVFVQADWATVDAENSTVSFVSVKNKDIAEVHFFERVSGLISREGEVNIEIDASSVYTAIEIRDQRIKEHLFAVSVYPKIVIRAQLDTASLTGVQRRQFPATLSLMGRDHQIQLDVLVAKLADQLTISSAVPILVSAAQVGLSDGVAKLAELAGGITIGDAVPVSFALSFSL